VSRVARAALLVLVLVLAAPGCRSGERRVDVQVVTEDQAPLRLGVPLADEPVKIRRQYQPLTAYLARGLSRKVDLVLSSTYKSVGWLLEQGKIELAWFSGVAFSRVSRIHPAHALARAVRRGKTTYVGLIVVRASSPIASLKDLRGKRLAYVDPASGSGFWAANQILLDAGLSPGADLASAAFTYGHLESLKAVRDGRYDAAAVFEGALSVYRGAIDPGDFRELARSRPLANDVVACSLTLAPALKERVRRLLLDMASTPEGRRGLAEMSTYGSLDAFVAVQ
jgi:phosphonate transport system substrate-binding protein